MRRGRRRALPLRSVGPGVRMGMPPSESIKPLRAVSYSVPFLAANSLTNPTAASVSTQPGETLTTRTPFGLTSLDRPLL